MPLLQISADPEAERETMTNTLHILLVDDDPRMTHTLADILALHGYQVSQATSGPEALRLAQETAFDCVLSDIAMPGMNGSELARQLYEIQPGLPVFFMTAYASEAVLQQGLAAGAVGVLEKPIDIQNLLDFLAGLCEARLVTIVDNDSDFCRTLGEILERRGFRVACVNDPHTDIETMLAGCQILLLDMKLNSINGRDLLETIRRSHPDLPVVLVTGYRQEMAAAVKGALALHAAICFYKPLAIPDLLTKLSEIQRGSLKKLWKATQK
jgi:two-component system response regulator HydG